MSKEKTLKEIESKVRVCAECRLWEQRIQAVPGDGDANATMMFIGEAPGRQEDLKGLPFVGSAGKLLDKLLCKVGLSRKEVYITNIVKCRPPRNRDPATEEVTTCTKLYLNRQIQVIQPTILLMLGRHSSAYILSEAGVEMEKISKIHGKVFEIRIFGFPVMAIPMFHPAAALYNAKYNDLLLEDFSSLKPLLRKHGY